MAADDASNVRPLMERPPDGTWRTYDLADNATVEFCPAWLSQAEADELLALSMPSAEANVLGWKQDLVTVGGRETIEPRLTTFLGERDGLIYTYSSRRNVSRVWPAAIDAVRRRIEAKFGTAFNVALCNLYQSGEHHVGWHSDSEADLVPGSRIVTLSLGGTRVFQLRHRTDSQLGTRQSELRRMLASAERTEESLSADEQAALAHVVGADPTRNGSIDLRHGDLLAMGGAMQQHWRHRVPVEREHVAPRIVFTFRSVFPDALA